MKTRDSGEFHGMTGAEMGVMQPQAKECLEFPENHQMPERSKGIFFFEFQRQQGPAL